MWYGNGRLFTPAGFVPGAFEVENGRFRAVVTEPEARAWDVDLEGARVIPGLVDIHTHGNSGADFSDGDGEGLARMARYLAANGVTAFAPTSMTLPYERLSAAFATARALYEHRPTGCARVAGIHMEGPFFSEKKKGAQNGAWLKAPDIEAFEALQRGCGGLVRIVDVAPELPGAAAFIARAKAQCRVSLAHTDADYADAGAAFEAGADHVTHLLNAMPPIHHRKPGVIGAASEREGVKAELICDGYHVHPSSVRMAFKLFPGRICLISDALRCCGMPQGAYELGGQQVFLQEGVARLADGTIAGAATHLYQGMLNAIRFGVPATEAVLSATRRPAEAIGAAGALGAIEPGKLADFVVCGEDLERIAVWLGGERV
ncbi:MAG: N-acetylglucosamine-6-phosphate deacetylase [Clostridia bacterium]|nr:N-acetylglucosamine-6-phosphate deacetylase [Clostridia bacterium]